MNLFEAELNVNESDPDGYRTNDRRLAPELGGKQIAFNVFEMAPGQSVCPYHYEDGCEEWIIVLSGSLTIRTPEGEHELGPWDCYFCPAGEAGAHKVTNPGDKPCRIVIWSNYLSPATAVYPDSNKLGAWPIDKLFRISSAVEYFDGEL